MAGLLLQLAILASSAWRPSIPPPPTTSTPTTTSANIAHSPLSIPEILALILSHCNHHTLRIHTSLVNHLWHTLSQELVLPYRYKAHFVYTALTSASKLSSDLRRSYLLDCNEVLSDYSFDAERPRHNWILLQQIVSTLAADGGNEWKTLKEIVVRGQVNIETRFYPILPHVRHIRVLRLLHHWNGRIDIGIILRTCPELTDLVLKPGWCASHHTDRLYGPVELESGGEDGSSLKELLLPVNKLSLLELSKVTVERRVLLRLISASPELRIFRLSNFQGPTPNQPYGLMAVVDHLAQSCPHLSSLYLSCQGWGGLPGECFTHAELMTLLGQTLPKVTDWTFSGMDITDATSWTTLYPFQALSTLQVVPNHITSLEIAGPAAFDYRVASQESLHTYLCSSPHLVHLRARDFKFSTKYLNVDLGEVLSFLVSPSSKLEAAAEAAMNWMPRMKNRYPPWVCRKLETLHLYWDQPSLPCSQKQHPGDWKQPAVPHLHYSTPRNIHGRKVFGYLVRVCPRLKDLEVRHNEIDLRMTSGLNLLLRLKSLERLVVESMATGQRITAMERDFLWIGRGMGGMTLLERLECKALVRELKALAEDEEDSLASPLTETGTNTLEPTKTGGKTRSRWQDYGRVRDVVRALEERVAKEKSRAFWPMLETLRIRWEAHEGLRSEEYQGQLKSVLNRWRPDVQMMIGPEKK